MTRIWSVRIFAIICLAVTAIWLRVLWQAASLLLGKS